MAARITVNSTDDSNIRNAVLTLREAILVANGTLNVPALTVAEQAQINGTVGTGADRDTIAFNIGAIGSQQLIQPLSALPPISDPAIVDGWSQGGAGYNGLPLVELSGNLPGVGMVGLDITAGNSTVQGLAINRFTWQASACKPMAATRSSATTSAPIWRVRSIGATAGGSGLMAFQIIGSRTT
jgi:hypothetical protein